MELLKKLLASLCALVFVILSVFNITSIAANAQVEEVQMPSTIIIDVPYINTNKIVYGCEAVSATMLLQYYGYKIVEKDFTDKYLIKKNWHYGADGKAYGPDPNAAFSGSPYISGGTNCGYGIFAHGTAKSIDKILDSKKHETKVITDLSLDELAKTYVAKNIPVLVWATMDMKPSRPGDSWIINYIDENSTLKIGDKFTWPAGEHCLVFVGYDEKNYYFNDPYKNHGRIAYDKKLANQRFLELKKQSVVIVNKQNELLTIDNTKNLEGALTETP